MFLSSIKKIILSSIIMGRFRRWGRDSLALQGRAGIARLSSNVYPA
jgi:hypothetical protein